MLFVIFPFVFNFCQFDYYVSRHVSPWVYPAWDSLCFPELTDYFLSHIREVFNYNLFKYFFRPFLFLFFWDPYNLNVGAFNVVLEVSETVLNSFHSSFFTLLFSSCFHYFIFQITYLFFCLCYSAIDSFKRILNFIYCVVHHCLFCSFVLLGPC